MPRVAFDVSSLIWTSLLVGKDPEGVYVDWEDKQVLVNTARYGYEHAVNTIVTTLKTLNLTPKDAIFVIEGFNSKAPRLMIDSNYKGSRGKRPVQAYEEFAKLRDTLQETFRKLGSVFVTQNNCEADDTLAWLAANTKDTLYIRSRDNDLLVLHGTNAYGASVHAFIGDEIGLNPYGLFDTKYVTLYKAMVGDTSDSIPGIKGFGPAAWKSFHKEFGEEGMAEMVRLLTLGSLEELAGESLDNKMVEKIYEARDQLLKCWKLASLHPEWVDQMGDKLVWEPGFVHGTVDDERLRQYKAAKRLVTKSTFPAFVQWAGPIIQATKLAALDIETSTPDESDEWMAFQKGAEGVDIIGSELTGLSLTFGPNNQYTVYIPVDHKETDNVDKSHLGTFLLDLQKVGTEFVIHNTQFEGTVLFNEYGKLWKENGYEGLLANWRDTKFEASYVDENGQLGLKYLSKHWLDYDQVEYKTVTTINDVQYKMRELTAEHVFDYACDDTQTTAGLHNFFKLVMELEGTYQVYLDVELDASYLHVQSFVHGTSIDLSKLRDLAVEDKKVYDEAWPALRDYLIAQGWDGTVCPTYATPIEAKSIKEACLIATGSKFETMVRTPAKLLDLLPESTFKACIVEAVNGDITNLNKLVASKFRGNPEFNLDSPVQMAKLLYERLAFEPKVFNKPTVKMREDKRKVGNPKTDELALGYCFSQAPKDDPRRDVLTAIRLMKMVMTRNELYYNPYPYFMHWKTGRLHSSHNQCATNTRRASSSKPNVQQLAKNTKIDDQVPKIREVFIPHKRNAVVVSLDFAAQELRVIADYSQDPGMLACFVGDELKDMHALTGLGIARKKEPEIEWSYEMFMEALEDQSNPLHKPVKGYRRYGKLVNFVSEFGAQAGKVAATLLISEEEAQAYLDAKEAAFPVATQWKKQVIHDAKQVGHVKTKLGAVRHLAEFFTSSDYSIASKAERQSVNTKVQGSAAEMTKRAEGRMFKARLEQRFDCEIMFPVHDEVVVSCAIEDLYELIPAMHACMVADYANMKVPIKSSISFGKSFGPAHQIEIGDEPSFTAIEKGLKQLEEIV